MKATLRGWQAPSGKEHVMKKLQVSAALNLCPRKAEQSAVEYVRDSIRFYRENGFDTADFGTTLLDLSSPDRSALTSVGLSALPPCPHPGRVTPAH